MTSDECRLIADAHGWRLSSSRTIYMSLEDDIDVMAHEDEGEWHLTDAGAFRVLVEVDWPNLNFLEGALMFDESPHTAVAMARLAQLQP